MRVRCVWPNSQRVVNVRQKLNLKMNNNSNNSRTKTIDNNKRTHYNQPGDINRKPMSKTHSPNHIHTHTYSLTHTGILRCNRAHCATTNWNKRKKQKSARNDGRNEKRERKKIRWLNLACRVLTRLQNKKQLQFVFWFSSSMSLKFIQKHREPSTVCCIVRCFVPRHLLELHSIHKQRFIYAIAPHAPPKF